MKRAGNTRHYAHGTVARVIRLQSSADIQLPEASQTALPKKDHYILEECKCRKIKLEMSFWPLYFSDRRFKSALRRIGRDGAAPTVTASSRASPRRRPGPIN